MVRVKVMIRVSKSKAGTQAVLAVSGRAQKVCEQTLIGRLGPCLAL